MYSNLNAVSDVQLNWEQLTSVLNALKRSVDVLSRLIHLLSATNTTTNVRPNLISSTRQTHMDLSEYHVTRAMALPYSSSSDVDANETVHSIQSLVHTLLATALEHAAQPNVIEHAVSRDSLEQSRLIVDLIILLHRALVSEQLVSPRTGQLSHPDHNDDDDDEDDGVNVIIRPIRHPTYSHNRSSTRETHPDQKTSSIDQQDKSTQTDGAFWRSSMMLASAENLNHSVPSVPALSDSRSWLTASVRQFPLPTCTTATLTTDNVRRHRWRWNSPRARQPKPNPPVIWPHGRHAPSHFTHSQSSPCLGDWNRGHHHYTTHQHRHSPVPHLYHQ